jgi:hypothetical protein
LNTSPTDVSGGRQFRLSWPLLVGAGTFLLLFRRQELLNDGDTYWHIAAGRWMLEHLAIPTVDPFSHTVRGAPWMAHEWLSEILYATAYDAGGWAAVAAIAVAALAAALAILARYLLRHLEPAYALVLVAVAATLAMGHLLARPHVLAMPVLVYWTVSLLRARERNDAPAWRLAPLMTLWANLHGSFPLGLGLAAAFATEAIIAAANSGDRWRAARCWGAFLIAAVLAALLNPRGINGLLFANDVRQMSFALDTIDEWRSPDFHKQFSLEIWLLAGVAAMLMRGLRLPPLRLLLLLGVLHLTLRHVRYGELLGLLAPLLVAAPFANQLLGGAGGRDHAERLDRFFQALAQPAGRAARGICLALLCVGAAVSIREGGLQPAAAVTPEAALRALRTTYHGGAAASPGPVLNSYNFGGYLIFAGVAPFIDGRADPYGDAFIREFVRALNLDDPNLLPQLLERYHIGWTLLQPGTPAVAVLDLLPGWRRLYSDETAIVHVRVTQASVPAGSRLARFRRRPVAAVLAAASSDSSVIPARAGAQREFGLDRANSR